MGKLVLRTDNISKRYRIGVKRHSSIKDLFLSSVGKFNKSNKIGDDSIDWAIGRNKGESNSEFFWALRKVNFEVYEGDAVGIIGRNGAGKSTLLKILSRITKPTYGRFWLEGRVSSLLEVGTGFHPELSGRENVYLNGTILGMKKREIKNRFDEIVDFSGVNNFIDTPIKHYSSGMKVRLAFSVASHLDPEILIIDEVLAVGDAEFQKKCLGKMEDVTSRGRTVIFVSHNMRAISDLCNQGILLDHGKIIELGEINRVVNRYLNFKNENIVKSPNDFVEKIEAKQIGQKIEIRLTWKSKRIIGKPMIGFTVKDPNGNVIYGSNPLKEKNINTSKPNTHGVLVAKLLEPRLKNGNYSLSIWFSDDQNVLYYGQDVLNVEVNNMGNYYNPNPKFDGYLIPRCEWESF